MLMYKKKKRKKKGKGVFDGKFFLKEGQGCVDLFVLCCDCGAWWCSLMPSTTTTTTATRGNGGQSLCAHQNLTPHLQPLLPLLLLPTHTASVPHPLCPPCLANHPHTIIHHAPHTPPLHSSTIVLHHSTINTPTVRSLPTLRCLQVHGRKDQR